MEVKPRLKMRGLLVIMVSTSDSDFRLGRTFPLAVNSEKNITVHSLRGAPMCHSRPYVTCADLVGNGMETLQSVTRYVYHVNNDRRALGVVRRRLMNDLMS